MKEQKMVSGICIQNKEALHYSLQVVHQILPYLLKINVMLENRTLAHRKRADQKDHLNHSAIATDVAPCPQHNDC